VSAGRWPRRISEDRLIADHIIPIKELDPLPVADADRRDFATIIATAKHATISFSRRDVEGRLFGRSPLIGDLKDIYPSRGRIPDHAASESDRLLARPSEFQTTPIARSGLGAWQEERDSAIRLLASARITIFSGSPSSSSKPQVSLETLPKKILSGVVVGAGRAGHPI
jgi:hypothetical protein